MLDVEAKPDAAANDHADAADNNNNDDDDAVDACRVVALTDVDVECDVVEPREPIVPIASLRVDDELDVHLTDTSRAFYFAMAPLGDSSNAASAIAVVCEPLDDSYKKNRSYSFRYIVINVLYEKILEIII